MDDNGHFEVSGHDWDPGGRLDFFLKIFHSCGGEDKCAWIYLGDLVGVSYEKQEDAAPVYLKEIELSKADEC